VSPHVRSNRPVVLLAVLSQEFLRDRQELFGLWLANEKDLGQLQCAISRRRVAKRLGRSDYVAKKKKQVLESFADSTKGEQECARAKAEGRFFFHPSFPGDEEEGSSRLAKDLSGRWSKPRKPHPQDPCLAESAGICGNMMLSASRHRMTSREVLPRLRLGTCRPASRSGPGGFAPFAACHRVASGDTCGAWPFRPPHAHVA
jgi:hypothetical protein